MCRSAPSPLLFRLAIPQDVRQVAKVTIEQFADSFMVLQSEVVIVAVRRGQVDETFQREGKTLSVQEVRGREGREVKVRDVSEAGERVAPQERFCQSEMTNVA